MARARNIKPGFFMNEMLAELEPMSRLLFIGLWCLADREGRIEDRPKRIKMELFPCDAYDVSSGLDNLRDAGFVERYEAAGVRVISVVNFHKHQAPHGTEKNSELPDKNGFLTVHERSKNNCVTGQSRLVKCESTSDNVKPQLENALNPESRILNPDSLNPESRILNPDEDRRDLSPAPEIFTMLKSSGITAINQSNPTFIALIKAGATFEEFKGAAFKAVKNNARSFAYVLKVMVNQREEAAKLTLHQGAMPERPRNASQERAETIAHLTGSNRNERPTTNERDITAEAVRIA